MLRDSRIERRNAAEAVGSLGGEIGVIVIVLHHIVAGRSHGPDHGAQMAKAGVVGGFGGLEVASSSNVISVKRELRKCMTMSRRGAA
jgi:hypothetical protein